MRFLKIVLLALLLSPAALAAGPVTHNHVEAELFSEQAGLQPGATQWVGVRLKMDPHWHTYWENPGDSGLPTKIEWKLPPGFEAGPIRWPYPQRVEVSGLVSMAYEGQVLLLTELKVPKDLPPEPVTLKAHVTWLACEETCIPGKADLDLTLPVSASPSPGPLQAEFEQARAMLPREGARAEARLAGETGLLLDFELPDGLKAAEGLQFFPLEGMVVKLAAPQKLVSPQRLEIERETVNPEPPKTLKGLLVQPGQWAVTVDAPLVEGGSTGPPATAAPPEAREALLDVDSVGVALLCAFGGGIILNLMPCVFPVLSLKVMGFIEHGAGGQGLRQAVVFTLGVLLSFWVLGGGLLALRSGGQGIGWGFQLQHPTFVILMAVLFFLLALNLLGVFEVGLGFTRLGNVAESGSGTWGSFLSGVLATLVATPCTAPYMGAAIGYSLTQPAWVVMAVFSALALGMASPYLVLAAWPGLVDRLPRPGRWMETFKQAMAFPLLLTVVFFAWVLGRQTGPEGMAALLAGLVFVGLGGWVYGRWGMELNRARVAAALCLVAGLSVAVVGTDRLGSGPAAAAAEGGGLAWEPYSEQRLQALLDEEKPVFLDFTAAWCLSCQVNERVALADAGVQQAFRDRGVATMKADWTNHDEAITEALARFDRSGVPLYVLYTGRKGDAPVILPEVLTPSIVLDHLEKLPRA